MRLDRLGVSRGDGDIAHAVAVNARMNEPQRLLAGGETAEARFLELSKLHREIAREADGLFHRDRLREPLDARGFQLGEIELEQVGAGDTAQVARKIIKRDDAQLAVLFERQRAFGEPRGFAAEVEIAPHKPVRELGHGDEERTVEKTLSVKREQVLAELPVGLRNRL